MFVSMILFTLLSYVSAANKNTCVPDPLRANGKACVYGNQCASFFCCPFEKICMANASTAVSSSDIQTANEAATAVWAVLNTQDQICTTGDIAACMCYGADDSQGPGDPSENWDITQCACKQGFLDLYNAETWVVCTSSFDNCTCTGGTAATGAACTSDAGHICTACTDAHFHVNSSDKQCKQNVCVCPLGTAVTGADCTTHDATLCADCTNDGTDYTHNTGTKQCDSVRACDCDGGTEAKGADCVTAGDATCAKCDAGYTLNDSDKTCGGNTCTCSGGTKAEGADCTSSSEICTACSSNTQHVATNKSCADNTCTCSNGTVVDSCTTHDANACKACNNNFTLNGSKCDADGGNVCTCTNGTKVDDADCTTKDANECKSCSAGYKLASKACTANACTCTGGTGASGSACTTDGNAKCASCNTGKKLNDKNECVDNVCTCQNGTGATGSACATDATAVCSGCLSGYKLKTADNTCISNVCTCSGGTPMAGATCTKDGAELCQSCSETHELGDLDVAVPTKVCTAYSCSCKNGTKDTTLKCNKEAIDNVGQLCLECDDGYTLDKKNTKCKVNKCKCTNGIAVPAELCTKNGAEKCESCEDGYELKSGKCEEIIAAEDLTAEPDAVLDGETVETEAVTTEVECTVPEGTSLTTVETEMEASTAANLGVTTDDVTCVAVDVSSGRRLSGGLFKDDIGISPRGLAEEKSGGGMQLKITIIIQNLSEEKAAAVEETVQDDSFSENLGDDLKEAGVEVEEMEVKEVTKEKVAPGQKPKKDPTFIVRSMRSDRVIIAVVVVIVIIFVGIGVIICIRRRNRNSKTIVAPCEEVKAENAAPDGELD